MIPKEIMGVELAVSKDHLVVNAEQLSGNSCEPYVPDFFSEKKRRFMRKPAAPIAAVDKTG